MKINPIISRMFAFLQKGKNGQDVPEPADPIQAADDLKQTASIGAETAGQQTPELPAELAKDTQTRKKPVLLDWPLSGWLAVVQQRYNRFGGMMLMPLSCLACAGLIMVLGDFLARLAVPQADILLQAGLIVYQYAPLLVAVGIVNGLITHEKGLAVIAATITTLVWTAAMVTLVQRGSILPTPPVYSLGWLTGLATGFLTYFLFHVTERKIRAPLLSRLINPHTLVIWQLPLAVVGGSAMGLVWLTAERILSRTAVWIDQAGETGLFVYGMLNRLLLPLGLHHILDHLLWQHAGEFTSQSGQLVQGDLSRFLAGDPTAGRYTAGFFPLMLIVVPAVLLAVFLAGRAGRRLLPGLLLLAAGLISLLGGITEPADFLILLFSPLLYAFYAILAGSALVLAAQLQILHGFSFSAGLIDYLALWDQATRPGWLLLVGAVLGVIAFVVFWLVLRFVKGIGPDIRLEQTGAMRHKSLNLHTGGIDLPDAAGQADEPAADPVQQP